MKAFVAAEQAASEDNLWNQFVNELVDLASDIQMWKSVGTVIVRIILILIISRLALFILNRVIDHLISEKETHRLKLRTRRVQTVGRLLKNAAAYTVNFIAILLILGEFHIQIAPLLAGAGVLGLAIGFGAQSLVKDVITGFFIIIEDQFAVGDVIQTGGFKGTVEMIGLRSTRIRNWTGEVHIIPNGSINEVTNFSVNHSLAVIDIPIAQDEHAEPTMAIIRSALNKLTDSNLIGIPELVGIQSLALNQITIRITAECKPNTHAEVTRAINAAVKNVLESKRMEVS